MINYSIHISVAFLESQIRKIEERLFSIEDEIRQVERKVEDSSDERELMVMYMNEKKQLRDEKKQLRDEKKQLREQQLVLMKKEQPFIGMYLNNSLLMGMDCAE